MRKDRIDPGAHPDLEILLSRRDKLLPAETAAEVDAHLDLCVLCRLALKQASRFEELDRDDEAAAEADWARAESRMDHAWRNRSRPHVSGSRPSRARWLVPLAAAAILALAAVNLGEREILRRPGDAADSVRGGPVTPPVIQALAPRGELDTIPAFFEWQAEDEFECFDLELFTEDMLTVLTLNCVEKQRAVLPDSVCSALVPGQTYFWHVKDGTGIATDAASETVWFRLVKGD